MKKIYALIILILLIASLPIFQGCATEPASIKIENSLSSSKLAYYSDSFDKLREEFWDKAGYMHRGAVRANFKQANMIIQDGR